MPRLQRLAAQPCGASRVLRTALRAPSPMDGHPAFFRRFQRRRCPPPSSPLTWPSGAPRWTLKSPDARPSTSVGKRGFAPTDLFVRLSLSAPGLRPKNQRLPQPGDPAPGAKAPHSPAPGRPVAFGSKLVDQARGTAPPACCPLALASSLRRLAMARATGSARLAVARLQVPPGSHAMQRACQAACGFKSKPHSVYKFKPYAAQDIIRMQLNMKDVCSLKIKTYAVIKLSCMRLSSRHVCGFALYMHMTLPGGPSCN